MSRCRSGLIDAKRSLSKAGHENPHNEAHRSGKARRRAQKLEDEERRRAQKLEDEARRKAEREKEKKEAEEKRKAERIRSKIETQLISAGGQMLKRGLLGILKK